MQGFINNPISIVLLNNGRMYEKIDGYFFIPFAITLYCRRRRGLGAYQYRGVVGLLRVTEKSYYKTQELTGEEDINWINGINLNLLNNNVCHFDGASDWSLSRSIREYGRYQNNINHDFIYYLWKINDVLHSNMEWRSLSEYNPNQIRIEVNKIIDECQESWKYASSNFFSTKVIRWMIEEWKLSHLTSFSS